MTMNDDYNDWCEGYTILTIYFLATSGGVDFWLLKTSVKTMNDDYNEWCEEYSIFDYIMVIFEVLI